MSRVHLFAGLLLVAGTSNAMAQKVGEHVVVTADQSEIKIKTDVVDTAHLGQVLLVVEVQGDWFGVMDRAFGYIEKRNVLPFKQAGEYFDRAIRRNSRDKQAYAARASVWRAHGQVDKAIEDYNQAIRLDPNSAALLRDRGMAWKVKGNLANALADFDAAIRLNPSDSLAFTYRGTLWEQNGEFIKALTDYAEASKLDPNDRRPHNNLAWIMATCASDELRDGRRAVERAIRACELSAWKDTNYMDTLAAAYAEAGDFDSAVTWQTKAIEGAAVSAKPILQARLELYESKKPYREQASQ